MIACLASYAFWDHHTIDQTYFATTLKNSKSWPKGRTHLNFEIEIQPQFLNFCHKFSASGPVAKITLTPELDETLRRIQDSKNVAGIILINKEGITVKSSLDSSVTALVSSSI